MHMDCDVQVYVFTYVYLSSLLRFLINKIFSREKLSITFKGPVFSTFYIRGPASSCCMDPTKYVPGPTKGGAVPALLYDALVRRKGVGTEEGPCLNLTECSRLSSLILSVLT